jgi:hypothetical protein
VHQNIIASAPATLTEEPSGSKSSSLFHEYVFLAGQQGPLMSKKVLLGIYSYQTFLYWLCGHQSSRKVD